MPNTKTNQNHEQEIEAKMLEVANLIEQNQEVTVENVIYYQDFTFRGSGLAETQLLVAKIADQAKNTITYEIYSSKTNSLIATVDEQGKLHFMPEYIESLKQIDKRYVEMLKLDDLIFELPQELAKEDKVLTREEMKVKSPKQKNRKAQITSNKEQEEEELQEKVAPEEQEKRQIARAKKVPSRNILVVKRNSNLYKDHPELEKLEPNLYFYRDSDGIVKAEYLDQNGVPQPSKYFEPSTTAFRNKTVSLGDDGNPVTQEVPYQVMQTKKLNRTDKDIRDIRITINIDTYGYLEIAEARQGKNGEWLSHDIEVKGRNYNSHEVNEATSIKTRKADPDKQTELYKQTASTGLIQDGIQYSEMYLIEHAQEIIEGFVLEGYQKQEAIQIFDYMIGQEPLTEEQAKQKVNEQIVEKPKEQQKEEQEQGEERTPWGDAEARRQR